MPITVGSRLLQYELAELIGEGGMGRVFHARDTRLGRSVAIKVLPDAFVGDAERIARFEREAKMLASLNHPNIASLIGMEQADGTHFLVMELIEGDTIAERLRRGPMPIAEALATSVAIAEALEAAHERGVVHRDLKPANVKVTPDGNVKVLDFGLAKAMDSAVVNLDSRAAGAVNSPTLSMMATQAGVILGTAAYMSPEQAKGAPADARSDIFSFGCLFFEMLSGRQAFPGENAAEVLALVLIGEPDFTLLPPQLDPRLRSLLRRCLEKTPKKRWQASGDLKVELQTMASDPAPAANVPIAAPRTLWRRATPVVLTALVLTGVAGTVSWKLKPTAAPSPAQFYVYPPEGSSFTSAGRPGASPVISPDGRTLVFASKAEGGQEQLSLRPINGLTSQPLAGTEGASLPFWSPDSRFIGFFADGKLLKISVSGGPPQTLCDAPTGRGGAWNREGTIIFQGGGGTAESGLFRVSSAGGVPTAATRSASQNEDHRFPSFLPDGRHFLFHVNGQQAIFAGSLDSDRTTRLIASVNSGAVFSSSGHLLFVKQGTLLAQPFDPETLAISGEPLTVAQDVGLAFTGHLPFSVSETGTLVYGVGARRTARQQLVWVDRQGQTPQQVGAQGLFKGLELSPTQTQLVTHREQGESGGDVWVVDLERGTSSRLTLDGPQQHSGAAIWSPDGKQIAYNTLRDGKWMLKQKPASGLGNETVLLESDARVTPAAWSPDGQMLVFQRQDPTGREDISVLPVTRDRKPFVFQNSGSFASHPQVSPDGQWLAYTSNETRVPEVYVRSFPNGPTKRIVSAGGGGAVRWRADGKELFYVKSRSGSGLGMLMAVEFRASESSLELGRPVPLFETDYLDGGPDRGGSYHAYGVSPDGQRFLIPRAPSTTRTSALPDPIVVKLNWATTLKITS